jgi:manganese/iron transport system permease protein
LGTYLSYFIDGATGGVIVLLQAFVFVLAFIFAPKHGLLARHNKITNLVTNKSTPLDNTHKIKNTEASNAFS